MDSASTTSQTNGRSGAAEARLLAAEIGLVDLDIPGEAIAVGADQRCSIAQAVW